MKQLLFTLIVSVLFSNNIIAQGQLTGLKYFIVDAYIGEELEKEGYNWRTIKTDVELKLRLADVNVIDREQLNVMDYEEYNYKYATLLIEVGGIVEDIDYTYSISLNILEHVKVPRLNMDYYPAETWEDAFIGRTKLDNRGWQFIRERAKELTDRFLNDYLRDNPKN